MKKSFIILINYFLFLLIIPYLFGAKDYKFTVGVEVGYSLNSLFNKDDEWIIEPGIRYKSQDKFGIHLGMNIQYSLFPWMVIQGEIDYQRQTGRYEEYINQIYYSHTQNESFVNYLLNIILMLNNPYKNKFTPYLFSGLGIEEFIEEKGWGYIGRIGLGLKYNLSPHTFLNLRIPFTYSLYDFNLFEPTYFNLNIGFEFKL